MPTFRLPTHRPLDRRFLVGTLLLALLLAGGAAWLSVSNTYAAGYVRDVQPIDGTTQSVLEISPFGPAFPNRYVVVDAPQSDLRGHWVLARGTPRKLSTSTSVVDAQVVERLPYVDTVAVESAHRTIQSIGVLASTYGAAALVLGLGLMVLGLLPLRLLAAGLLGLLLGSVAWHVAVIGVAEGWFKADPGLMTVVFLGFGALGALLGLRGRGVLARLAQHVALVVVLLTFAPALSAQFGWPLLAVQIIGVIAPVLSRPAGLVLLIGFLLSAGLGATVLVSNLVLVATAIGVHFAHGGRWLDVLYAEQLLGRARGARTAIRLQDTVNA